MNVHQNARLTPHSRAELVRRVGVEGQTPTAVAAAFGVTVKTVRKWVARFQTEGTKGLQDRSSRPHHLHRPTPAATVATIEALRRQRWTGQQITAAVGVSPATISRILRGLGLTRIQALEPAPPVRRYEREHPGELIHIDIKKLGRFDCVGHRITGDRTVKASAGASGGSSSTSASTMPPGWPSRSSFLTRKRRARSPSSRPRSPTTRTSASRLPV